MRTNLDNKVVVVTGGYGAIGTAICEEFLKNGATVVVAGRNEESLKKSVESFKQTYTAVSGIVVDVSDKLSVEAMVRKTVNRYGKIDCIVNNAGINGGPDQRKPVTEYDDSLWDAILAVDLNGVYYCSKYAAREMVKQGGGSIINISSITGLTPLRLQCAFTAAKAGVVNFSKAIALELAEHNIRVNVIAPGSILFEGTRKLFYADKERAEALLSHIPQHRAGTPEDIAAMTCFLASEDASYMTGSVVTIDGGWTCGYTRDF